MVMETEMGSTVAIASHKTQAQVDDWLCFVSDMMEECCFE